jgi:hypothetical protein
MMIMDDNRDAPFDDTLASDGEQVVLFDLSSLRFRRDRRNRRFTALSADGQVLAGVSNPPENGRAAALAALDEAARTGRCWRGGQLRRIAFFNPHTVEAAFGPSGECRVFRFEVPPPLSREGSVAVIGDGVLVTDGDAVAVEEDRSALEGSIRTRIAAHRR